MIQKEERSIYTRYLSEASDSEIHQKRRELLRMLGLEPSGSELWRDIRFLLRLANEEIEARNCVNRLRSCSK